MKKFVYQCVLFLRLLTAHLLRLLSAGIPKQKGLWVFVGWHRSSEGEVFADNAKYAFLEAHAHPEIRAVWIAHDRKLAARLRARGFESYYENSLRGIAIALRAEVTMLDSHFDIHNWRTAAGSTIVQLWHGKGFKKVAQASAAGISHLNPILHPYVKAAYDYVIASSAYTATMMADSFRVAKDRVLVCGLPRNDILFRNIPGAEIDAHPELREIINRTDATEKLILYAPTFRRHAYDPFAILADRALHTFLESHNAKLIVSMHPKFYKKEMTYHNVHDRIVFVSPGYDIYPFLSRFDALITDYSSLFLEFTLLDKHTVFFVPDLQQFQKNPGLYDDYQRLTPGPKVETISEVCHALSESSEWKAHRAEVRSVLFAHTDGWSAKRVIEMIINVLTTSKD